MGIEFKIYDLLYTSIKHDILQLYCISTIIWIILKTINVA